MQAADTSRRSGKPQERGGERGRFNASFPQDFGLLGPSTYPLTIRLYMTDTTKRQQAVAYFVSQGWTLAQAAGIVANLEAESGLRPDAIGDGGKAYGIAQWHPPRQANFAAVMGKDIRGSSFEDQLAFVHAELQGTERAAGIALAKCLTAAEAGACVSRFYERPADREGEAAKRAALAERIFADAAPTPHLGNNTPPVGNNTTATAVPAPTQPEKPMPILALLSAFGPIIAQLIPQIATIMQPKGEVAQRNVQLAQVAFDTITKAADAANVQDAVEKMQADPALVKSVAQAVVQEPEIWTVISVDAESLKAARENDAKTMAADKPFYKTSAVFWISMVLLPLVYWYVGSSVVGGIEVPADWPWYAQLPLKLFGLAWSLDARSGMGNLVIGLVLGGICGVYYGISVTQQKQQQTANAEKP